MKLKTWLKENLAVKNPRRDRMVILQASAKNLQKGNLARFWQENGFLAKSARTMVILQDLQKGAIIAKFQNSVKLFLKRGKILEFFFRIYTLSFFLKEQKRQIVIIRFEICFLLLFFLNQNQTSCSAWKNSGSEPTWYYILTILCKARIQKNGRTNVFFRKRSMYVTWNYQLVSLF